MPDDEVAHDAAVDDSVDAVDDPVAADLAPGPWNDDLLPEDVDTDEWPGDDLLPEDTAPVPPSGPRRRSSGSVLGAAMMGLQQALYGKPHEETVIEVETSGDPPNIDLNGLDEQLGDDRRIVGPPLDEIKARRRPGRPSRSSRSPRRHR